MLKAIVNPFRRLRPLRRRRAFTLTELLVAIGVVAFLVVGVGQIFRSIGRFVSLGTAVAEVEQMARVIERQMREDFDDLSRMNADETFIAIRMREIGDVNRNNMVDGDEIAIYLSQDDREADQRDIAAGVIDRPYDEGSRAVTRRLDEIVFLAQPSSASYVSFQQDRLGRTDARADVARIYYGHALRPAPDPNWPPDPDAANPPRTPQRIYIPDGDFGQRAGDDNRFARGQWTGLLLNSADFNTAAGRNEHASRWILARHSLLLAGGAAAGNEGTRFGETRFANEREYAPYLRDLETIHRFWRNGPYSSVANGDIDHQGAASGRFDPDFPGDILPPAPRLIQHGRVDLCAQGLEDVRRWLEGEPWPSSGPAPPDLLNQRSFPFFDGRFGIGALEDDYFPLNFADTQNEFGLPDAPPTDTTVRGLLWQRPNPASGSPEQRFRQTRLGVRAAIAGTIQRMQASAEPPFIERQRRLNNVNYTIDNFQTRPDGTIDPEDALMDAHAILAEQCSDFRISWRLADPDWPVAVQDIDVNGDGVPEFRQGDRIWIDITPLDPDASGENPVNNSRSTVQNWLLENIAPQNNFTRSPFGQTGFFSAGQAPKDHPHQPEIGYADWRNPVSHFDNSSPGFPDAVSQTIGETGFGFPSGSFFEPLYNPDLTYGAPAGQREYLAIWPFRVPADSGGYLNQPFPKTLQIRINMTLHDAQRRIPGGREFEFVFEVSPRQPAG